MKKIPAMLIALLCYTAYVQAAESVKGKILTTTDTMDVTFQIPVASFDDEPNYIKLQEKVKYCDASGKEAVLRPDQAVEIQFTFRGTKVRMLSRFKSIFLGSAFSSNQYIFLKLVQQGEVTLFKHYYRASSGGYYNGATGMYSGGGSHVSDEYILQKGKGNLVEVYKGSFKETMTDYFSSCPALVEKIQNKTYRIQDMEAIVRFYNAGCK